MLDYFSGDGAPSYPTILSENETGITLESPAKVNLSLRVIGRREDGYHELDTWFQEISLCDRLTLERSGTQAVTFTGVAGGISPDNLVTRAIGSLERLVGRSLGVTAKIEKSIPVGGGLAGGSSNGTMTLVAINRLFKLKLSEVWLSELAKGLGSDCPFFLHGGLCRGRGRGEEIIPTDGCLSGSLLLVMPPFAVDTARAFENARFRLTHTPKSGIFKSYAGPGDHAEVKPLSFVNDLEAGVFESFPMLREVKSRLFEAGAMDALMSGSGSTMFGLFASESEAVEAAKCFEPPVQIHICRPVARRRS